MKKIFIILGLVTLVACKNEKKSSSEENNPAEKEVAAKEESGFESFGKKIDQSEMLTAEEMKHQFDAMKVGDTVNMKFTSIVNEVCKEKGCWMKLALPEDQETMVKFKDYKFFVPKDIDGKSVIVAGKAFVDEMPVDEQQHYAKDAGKSDEEIAEITEPKKTFSFMAEGVLVEK